MHAQRTRILVLAAVLAIGLAAAPADAADGTTVLGDGTYWRIHHTLKPPAIASPAGGTEPLLFEQQWLNMPTDEAAAGWQQPEFDDSAWLRGPRGMVLANPYLARICLRGTFMVDDPSTVDGLAVSVGYHGGVIITLNGREVARRHVAEGAALAEPYPHEAFVDPSGDLLVKPGDLVRKGKRMGRPSPEQQRRLDLWSRRTGDVAIPARLLRKGANVLAVEIVRAPYDRVVVDKTEENRSRNLFPYQLRLNACQLDALQLTAAEAAGLHPNIGRAGGFRVWNSPPMAVDYDTDTGPLDDPLRPIRLVGARGGVYSGKVMVGSDADLAGLRGTASDLQAEGGAEIPASAVRVRYGLPWGEMAGRDGRPREAEMLGCIAEAAPLELPAGNGGVSASVWVTVAVPRDAEPGIYRGRLTVSADGQSPVDVPVEIEVCPWTLPERFRTWVGMIQSPDTLALEYDVPMWSDEHFELIGRSFALVREAGCRIAYVPLVAHTNLGHAESMVRWIDRGEDRFDYDFTVFDRYLDVMTEHLGRPDVLVLNVWEVYMLPKDDNLTDAEAKREGKSLRHTRMALNLAHIGAEFGHGPMVTAVDPASGETETVTLPPYTEPVSQRLWAPLVKQVRQRLQKRGLADALMLGMNTDAWASKEEFEFWNALTDNAPWVFQGHEGAGSRRTALDVARVGYQTRVWAVRFADNHVRHGHNAGRESLHGWSGDQLLAAFERNQGLDAYPPTRWRQFGETNITGAQRGVGRIGADFWPVIKDRRGRRSSRANARYPEADWRNLDLNTSLLAPGPTGPAATPRLEAFREGIQECEARIVIERALTDEAARRKLGDDLVRRCEEALDLRMKVLWKSLSDFQLNDNFNALSWRWTAGVGGHRWFVTSDWQARSRQLYRLAGEVERKVGR